MKKIYSVTVVLIMSTFLSISAWGQNEAVLTKKINSQGVPSFIEFDNRSSLPNATEKQALLARILVTNENDEFRFRKNEIGNTGFNHELYDQFYKGVRVESGAYALHIRNGFIEKMNGSFQKLTDLDVVPSLSESQALQKALSSINASVYKWQVPAQEKWLKQLKGDPNVSFYPKGTLLIYQDLQVESQYYLAYKFIIDSQSPNDSYYVYVDAHNGQILLKMSAIIRVTDTNATADTRHSGSQTITTDQSGGTFQLRESGRGGGIQTLHFSSYTDFTDSDNNWTSSEFHNGAMDDAALDVHWAMEKTYDYWLNVHGRNSFNGSGALIQAFVHEPGVDAHWSSSTQTLTFGDGGSYNGMTYDPLTSLDICAHEFGHGVAQSTVNFNLTNEAQALNEGFSDIWGSCVEAYAAPGKNAWVTGEEIISGGAGYERSLQNPQANGYPDVYQGISWDFNSSPDPHKNSTVLSHCFYLLTSGGTSRNSNGTAYNINGVGRQEAEQITFLAERSYLPANPSATFSDTRTAMIAAATERHGSCSNEVIATTNAWYAAGVGNATGPIFGSYTYGGNTYVFTGSTGISVSNTSNNITINLANYGPSATYSWVITSQSGSSSYNFNNNNATITLGAGASFNVTCNVTNDCGSYSVSFSCYNYSGSFRMVAYPNPADQDLNVAAVKSSEQDDQFQDTNMAADKPVEDNDLVAIDADVRLLDKNNTVLQEGKLNKGRLNFSVAKIPDGIYYLQMTSGDKQIRKQIIIKH